LENGDRSCVRLLLFFLLLLCTIVFFDLCSELCLIVVVVPLPPFRFSSCLFRLYLEQWSVMNLLCEPCSFPTDNQTVFGRAGLNLGKNETRRALPVSDRLLIMCFSHCRNDSSDAKGTIIYMMVSKCNVFLPSADIVCCCLLWADLLSYSPSSLFGIVSA